VEWAKVDMSMGSSSSVLATYIISSRNLDEIEWGLQIPSKVIESRVQEHAELIGVREHVCSPFGIECIITTSSDCMS
jgi:hypothetical protein